MQPPGPPRPFRGAQYDKDMFTFLPPHSNRDVSAESSRKRKLNSSDHQNTVSAANARHGISVIPYPKLNAENLQGKEIHSSAPASQPRESSNFNGYSDQSQQWDQNDYAVNGHRKERVLNDSRSEYTGFTSFSGQLQSPSHKSSSSVSSLSEIHTQKTLNLPPPVTEDFSLHENRKPNSHEATLRGLSRSPLMTTDFSRCENWESNAHVATHKALGWQPPAVQNSYPHEIRESNANALAQKTTNWLPSMTQDFSQNGNCESDPHVTTQRTSNGPLLVTQDLKHHENREFNARVTRVENGPHSQDFWSFAHEKPKVMASDPYAQASARLGGSPRLPQNTIKPGAFIGGLDEKGRCEEETYKANCLSNIKEYGDAGRFSGFDGADICKGGSSSNVTKSDTDNFTGFDSSKAPGNNDSASVYNLQSETNNLLNVLRLLSAASGIGLADNNDRNVQGCGHDVKLIKSPPGSTVQNLNHPPAETNLSKKCEDGFILDKPPTTGEKGSVKLDDECKTENGASAFAEKLWDGTLQLSTSVSVSAIAFFKSGEKMQDFSWSESVEVKGKVRLEAFEKYVQDLPRSRSRGLMVMSLCWKDGSSDAEHKGMKEVARKYKEGKRVGFAKLSTDVDLYICPHSDAIITILAKHGFFKGMIAIKEKSDPLIGCVVWKKTSSSAPPTKSGSSLCSELESLPEQGKSQTPVDSVENNVKEKSPEILPRPEVDQPKQSMEVTKLILSIPSIPSKQSADFSDDDDLPEYDFKVAISQTSVSKTSEMQQIRSSHVLTPVSAEQKSVSSAVSISAQYSEAHKPSFPTQEQKQTGHSQGPATAPQNFGLQSDVKIPSLPMQEPKPIEKGASHLKPKNLFDDDDMPEWCPPDFMKIREEAAKRPGMSFSSSSEVPGSGPADSGYLLPLPPPPPPPPLTQIQLRSMNHPSAHLPKPAANSLVHENPGTLSSQVQFDEREYSPTPRVPPPPIGNPAANNFIHQRPAAPSTQIQFADKNLAAISSQMDFKDYNSSPYVPRPPIVNPTVSNIMHQSATAPSPQMQFGDKNSAAISSKMPFKQGKYPYVPHVPPPRVGNSATNNYMHQSSGAKSTQMQFAERNYSPNPRPSAPFAGRPTSEDVINQNSAFPPGFDPNPAFRPCFDQPGMKNSIPRSTRSSKP
ncbi:uncharacterized protein LOC104901975 [Beta vulgaris subsp. vulgaris]|uniref:uncharacterized protein LOC104901975 n=1 Tax=Beta vulgaris subsp. vulgaris TaxID=3555 RepID=UPI002037579B|nr:uncharacterized protein LOC104901975 [Beta vulgaris subsp. vulgaris]XP_010687914.2 uncharacterized protein LOC104901975 [Beta vulgaris subsp. vulgaris]XP_048490440.1 uncharacterized protein LOC104901975 [Beta vulgaris subsp. vulgaris]